MDILKYIDQNYLILVAMLYVIGAFLKGNSKVKDWLIPWILLVISIGFSVWLGGFSATVIIQGALVAGAAVLTNQLYKQTITEGLAQFFKKDTPESPKEINPTNTTNDMK